MTDESIISLIPDAQMTRATLEKIDVVDGIQQVTAVTWQGSTEGNKTEVTEDIIIVTPDRVRYLSRKTDDGWVVEQEETYADDEEFERIIDDVEDYAVAYAEAKAEMQIENFFGE